MGVQVLRRKYGSHSTLTGTLVGKWKNKTKIRMDNFRTQQTYKKGNVLWPWAVEVDGVAGM